MPVSVLGISADGKWIVVSTPSALALCGRSDGADCGYATLGLTNPGSNGSANASPSSFSPSGIVHSATLACPPFCPGAYGASLLPYAADTPDTPYVLATMPGPSLDTLPVLEPPPTALSTTSAGIYYAASCAATGLYTDPAFGSCANASDPLSLLCAFGSGDACRLCPSNALCPGGNRMWSRSEGWVASETTGAVAPCGPPDPAR